MSLFNLLSHDSYFYNEINVWLEKKIKNKINKQKEVHDACLLNTDDCSCNFTTTKDYTCNGNSV